MYAKQPYLEILYKTIFLIGYYGMFRIGELTLSPHVMKAKDISFSKNKNKIQILLHSSKTHGKESPPQKIKISEVPPAAKSNRHRFFCPFAWPKYT